MKLSEIQEIVDRKAESTALSNLLALDMSVTVDQKKAAGLQIMILHLKRGRPHTKEEIYHTVQLMHEHCLERDQKKLGMWLISLMEYETA